MTFRRLFKAILRAVGILLVLAVIGLAGAYVWLRGSLPRAEGTLAVAGLAAPAEILRDQRGIVTVRAESHQDAVFALGYAHAQDRLWQMDFSRRLGAGRLSEVVGPATLRIDRLMRTIGLHRVAMANEAHLSPETRSLLAAYRDGVNAFMSEPGGPLPPEFQLLRYEPDPWRITDTLLWGRLMALQLSGNWRDEVLRASLASRLPAERIDALWPPYPADGPIIIPDDDQDSRARAGSGSGSGPESGPEFGSGALATRRHALTLPPSGRLAAMLPDLLPQAWAPKSASNSWVLGGPRTRSGKPILANDPHLGLDAPGTWYLARIETPELTLAGVTAPGVPAIVIGHNGHIAWGFTTTHSDTQDLFIERLVTDPADTGQVRYETPGGPEPFTVREERIEVRGEDARPLTVRTTRHGPVLSDVLPEAAALIGSEQVLALAWPALRDDDRSADALLHLNLARDWPGFLDAMRLFHSPQQNVVYADREGHIGVIAPGRVPIRKAGDGRLPVPGWDGSHDWTGYIPFEALPRLFDPPNGLIVAANNRLVGPGYPHLLTADWAYPQRARRIGAALGNAAKSGLSDSLALQLDTRSEAAAALVPLLLRAEPAGTMEAEARDSIAAWDLRMERDAAEPLIFYLWIRELTELIFADELAADSAQLLRPDVARLLEVLDGAEDAAAWCDDTTTDAPEDCNGLVARALTNALLNYRIEFGRTPARWRWGDAHKVRFRHPVWSRVPLLDRLVGYEIATDGGDYTVNRGAMRFSGPDAQLFEHVHGAGLRAVFDLSDLDRSRFIIATGQSGNPLSPHYGDLAEAWRDGDTMELVAPRAGAAKVLRLDPK